MSACPLTGNMSTACCNRSLGICPVWKPHAFGPRAIRLALARKNVLFQFLNVARCKLVFVADGRFGHWSLSPKPLQPQSRIVDVTVGHLRRSREFAGFGGHSY